MQITVDVPMDFSEYSTHYWRYTMEKWCSENIGGGWRRQWRVADNIARFHFDNSTQAVAFKLTFAELWGE